MQKLREKLKNKKGFTLVEMIVVLAIIGILIALIAPNMARIIKDGQETSDAAKAKTALTAAQAYGTRQVSAGQTVAPAAGVAVGTSGAFMIELNDTNMKAAYSLAPASTEDFMTNTGDAYLNTNVVKGSDKLYVYISKEGAPMGIVYTNGAKVKAVAGFGPAGVFGATPAAGIDFTTAALKDKTLNTGNGIIG